jgi:hypothetical protein
MFAVNEFVPIERFITIAGCCADQKPLAVSMRAEHEPLAQGLIDSTLLQLGRACL